MDDSITIAHVEVIRKFSQVVMVVRKISLLCYSFRYVQFLAVKEIVYNSHFFSLKIINPKNIHNNILEILDPNRISIEVTFLYFST